MPSDHCDGGCDVMRMYRSPALVSWRAEDWCCIRQSLLLITFADRIQGLIRGWDGQRTQAASDIRPESMKEGCKATASLTFMLRIGDQTLQSHTLILLMLGNLLRPPNHIKDFITGHTISLLPSLWWQHPPPISRSVASGWWPGWG